MASAADAYEFVAVKCLQECLSVVAILRLGTPVLKTVLLGREWLNDERDNRRRSHRLFSASWCAIGGRPTVDDTTQLHCELNERLKLTRTLKRPSNHDLGAPPPRL